MVDWREYLKPQEIARLEAIEAERRELMAEKLLLHDRAKKRRQRNG